MSDRLLKESDVIAYLVEEMSWYTDDGYEVDNDEKRDDITDIVAGIPSAEPEKIFCSPDAEWVPVSERLPEKDGSYLVCMNWDYHNMDVLMWADGWNCIRLINDKVYRKSEIDWEKITAWMPLPMPYREEGE